jgi:hypothetical protein
MDAYGNSTSNYFTGDVTITQDLAVGGDITVGGDIDFKGDVVIQPPRCLDTDCVQEITPSTFSLRAATGPAVLNIVDGKDINIYDQIHVDTIRSSSHQDMPDTDPQIQFLFNGLRVNSGGATALIIRPGAGLDPPTVAVPGVSEVTELKPFLGTQDISVVTSADTEFVRFRSANARMRVGTIGSHYDMPGADGTVGQYLRTDGAGDAKWQAPDPPALGATYIQRSIFTAITTTVVYPKGVPVVLYQPTPIGADGVLIADFPQDSVYTLRAEGYWNVLNGSGLTGTGQFEFFVTNGTGAFVLFEQSSFIVGTFQEYGFWGAEITIIRYSPTQQVCRGKYWTSQPGGIQLNAQNFTANLDNLAVGTLIRCRGQWTDNTTAPTVLTPIFTKYEVTLSTPTAGGINQVHNTLIGLAPGDAGHTDLALLTGRAGGQFLRGGTAPGDALALQASTGGGGQVRMVSNVRLDTGFHIQPQTGGVSDLGSQTEYMRNLWAVGLNLSPIGTVFTLGNDAEQMAVPSHRYISIYTMSNTDATSFSGGGVYSFIEGKTSTSANQGMDTDNAGRIINLGPDAIFRVNFTGTCLPLNDDETYSFLIYRDGAPVDGSYVSGYERNQPNTLGLSTHIMIAVPQNSHIQMACTTFSGNKFIVQDYSFSAEVML